MDLTGRRPKACPPVGQFAALPEGALPPPVAGAADAVYLALRHDIERQHQLGPLLGALLEGKVPLGAFGLVNHHLQRAFPRSKESER